MVEKFNKLGKLVRVILLLIPFVNWVTELVLRFSNYVDKKQNVQLVIAILAIPFGVIIGLLDCICVLVADKLLATNVSDAAVKSKIDNLDK